MSDSSELLLAVDFAGTGIHPSSWRRDDSRAEELFTPRYWADLVGAADRAGVDFAFLPDTFGVVSDATRVRGRLEAVGLAARLTTATTRIGLIPTATVTHTEPFHVAKAIQTIDHTTLGRAGWEVAVTPGVVELFGRKDEQDTASLWAEAHEAAEVAARLWDSWEDDAEIRDVATGRFIDRDKVHYIDFVGEYFSVKGSSIVPRSPQGQPLVAVTVTGDESFGFAAQRADLVRIRAIDLAAASELAGRIRAAAGDRRIFVLLDVDVLLGDHAAADLVQLEGWAGQSYRSDTLVHVGTSESLIELLGDATGVDGVTLRPLALPSTLHRLVENVLHIVRPGVAPATGTLRDRLGLSRPANRFAAAH
ncbi:LLM class flavin-dependent oxidoreductase [Rhodococcus rhodochrous]|uniref:LLM class flavin-dependent oxidoreductase n=1 Tax=Rhodococcus rhodochrous TaxID=1829 RepID=UPI001E4E42FC|nr:LLM class flavin-dependent oxidoreductase [Rhodococcus rhodochrous]MCB8909913.1 LLM class flavin-dependent oxidoreductase [Rhodococcus rhodochrous]